MRNSRASCIASITSAGISRSFSIRPAAAAIIGTRPRAASISSAPRRAWSVALVAVDTRFNIFCVSDP